MAQQAGQSDTGAATPPSPRRGGIPLGSIGGIQLRADAGVLVIMALIAYSLATGVFARWHPDWGAALRWGAAIAASILFFASLLAHELAHSLVAVARGIPVPRITLFLFGGVSEMGDEPARPGDEFWIAIVGPATSLLLGVVFGVAGAALAGPEFAERVRQEGEAALASLGLVPTLLLWLGPVNVMLGLFNLVPGFPLDGGRLLRALLWRITGSVERATVWSSTAGQAVAWGLVALGVFEFLQGAFGGLWLVLIGWFLNNAARTSRTQLLVRQRLSGVSVRDLMRTRFETVDAATPLREFIEQRLLRGAQDAWPVTRAGAAAGIVTFDDIRRVDPGALTHQTVGEVAHPIDVSIDADLSGRKALRALAEVGEDPIPVTDGGLLVGFLYHADIWRRLAIQSLDVDAA